MATWKKVIVSGSNVSQLNNDAGYLTSATSGKAFSSASYDGTSLLADNAAGNLSFASGSGQGLTISASVSNDTLTFGLSQIPNSSLSNTGSIIGNTLVDLGATVTTIDGLNLTDATATGSFSGSINGLQIGLGAGSVSTNIAAGVEALSSNTTGYNNIALGNEALFANTTGYDNTALGFEALTQNTTGYNNIGQGAQALFTNTTGYNNVSIGHQSLYGVASGVSNVALGTEAGYNASGSSSNNIYLGYSAGPSTPVSESNKLYINNTSGTPLIGGDFDTNTVDISGSLNVTGLVSAPTFTGSFNGNGSGLTNIASSSQAATASYVTTLNQDVLISGSITIADVASTFLIEGNGFSQTYLTANGTIVLNPGYGGVEIIGATNSLKTGEIYPTTVSASSYISASAFIGDGSQLTGIAATLNISGSTGDGAVALKTQVLSILGTNNEIETNASGQSITIGLPNDVTIGNDLIVSNNLTVFGTASFQNTTNLEVADRFILLASGSNTTGDGGLVVQQGTQNVGELLGWDSGVSRWALTGSFTANASAFTPDAYISAVTTAAETSPAPASRYNAVGNIYVSSGDESIWIYS
jgi:hypothetical protein